MFFELFLFWVITKSIETAFVAGLAGIIGKVKDYFVLFFTFVLFLF